MRLGEESLAPFCPQDKYCRLWDAPAVCEAELARARAECSLPAEGGAWQRFARSLVRSWAPSHLPARRGGAQPAGSAGSQGLPRGALPHCADEEAARWQGRDLASLPWLPRFGRCKLPVSFSRGLRGLFPSLPVRSWSLPRRLMSSQVLVTTAW